MKARITPKKEIILLYHLDRVKNADRLVAMLKMQGLEYKEVSEEELCFTTGELAGYQAKKEHEAYEGKIPETSAMAMGGLSSKKLDAILTGMRKEQVELPVKMVITPHNESWEFGYLIGQVEEEHLTFVEMERLDKLTKIVEKGEVSDLQKELLKKGKVLMAAMNKREDQQPEKEDFAALCDEIEKTLK